MHQPGRAAEPQHRGALPLDPDGVVELRPGAHRGLEQHVARRARDRDERGAALLRNQRQQTRVQQVAELPGVVGGEGVQDEGVALGFHLVGLVGLQRLSLAGNAHTKRCACRRGAGRGGRDTYVLWWVGESGRGAGLLLGGQNGLQAEARFLIDPAEDFLGRHSGGFYREFDAGKTGKGGLEQKDVQSTEKSQRCSDTSGEELYKPNMELREAFYQAT